MRDTPLSPKAAKTFIDAFEEAVGDLSTFPEGRPLVSDFDLAKRGYRWIRGNIEGSRGGAALWENHPGGIN